MTANNISTAVLPNIECFLPFAPNAEQKVALARLVEFVQPENRYRCRIWR
jgi:hypothetical protein